MRRLMTVLALTAAFAPLGCGPSVPTVGPVTKEMEERQAAQQKEADDAENAMQREGGIQSKKPKKN
jgi:hypothetical protein